MATGVTKPLYTRDILRLATSIPHLGTLDNPQGRAEIRSPTCGSTFVVEVNIDQNGRVSELGQQVHACAFGQASAALMGAHAVGRSEREIEEAIAAFCQWLDGCRDDPGAWPGLEALEPARTRRGRHGAMLMPFRGLASAIRAAQTLASL